MRKKDILIIDDEYTNVLLFEQIFKKDNNVYTFSDPQDAIEKLKNIKNIDIFFVDYRMPNLNGIKFIKECKKMFPKSKYVLLTALDLDDIKKLDDVEFDDNNYIRKPWEAKKINSYINER